MSDEKSLRSPTVCVVGLGYVGLATAACFANRRIPVVGIDIDHDKVRKIRRGISVIHEQGLEPLLNRTLQSGFLEVSTSPSAVAESDITFVTVGTPSKPDGTIDTTFVEDAARDIGRVLKARDGFRVVAIKSTVVPGTTVGRIRPILETESKTKIGDNIGLSVNPEFLYEGSAVHYTMSPEALIMGTSDMKTKEVLLNLYKKFYRKLPPLISTTPENAELIKYAINSFRAVQISYVNFLSNICARIEGGEMAEVVRGLRQVAKMDKRYLGAGLGFGGSCLPKDARALKAFAESVGINPAVLSSAIKTNNEQAQEAVRMARKLVGDLKGKKVAVLGLAFKAGTDDVRESTAFGVVDGMIKEHAAVVVFDPKALENARAVLRTKVQYAESAVACITGADVCVITTGWDEFKALKPDLFRKLMRTPAVVDGRRIYRPHLFQKEGVHLLRIGSATPKMTPHEGWEFHFTQSSLKVGAPVLEESGSTIP